MTNPESAKPEKTEFLIRKAIDGDIPQVVALDNAGFPTPWSESTYQKEVNNSKGLFYVALLTDQQSVMAGFILSWAVVDQLHILRVTVKNDLRKMGIGRALVEKTLEEAKTSGLKMALLEVRERNTAAIKLYLSLNFITVGLRRKYYTDTGEDALLLTASLVDLGL